MNDPIQRKGSRMWKIGLGVSTLLLCGLLVAWVWTKYERSRKPPFPDVALTQRIIKEAPLPEGVARGSLTAADVMPLMVRHKPLREWLLRTVMNQEEPYPSRSAALGRLLLLEDTVSLQGILKDLTAWTETYDPKTAPDSTLLSMVRQGVCVRAMTSGLSDQECLALVQRVFPNAWHESLLNAANLGDMRTEQLPYTADVCVKMTARAKRLLSSLPIGGDSLSALARWAVSETNYSRVETGMTQSQVLDLMGAPTRTYSLTDKDLVEWAYQFPRGQGHIVIQFDNRGTIRKQYGYD